MFYVIPRYYTLYLVATRYEMIYKHSCVTLKACAAKLTMLRIPRNAASLANYITSPEPQARYTQRRELGIHASLNALSFASLIAASMRRALAAHAKRSRVH